MPLFDVSLRHYRRYLRQSVMFRFRCRYAALMLMPPFSPLLSPRCCHAAAFIRAFFDFAASTRHANILLI